ncbi:ANTAR domain-containing protein [Streptomyces sp. NPDC096013]|uniref:ANTAR domain-containing protein n=1 Tax=Streptomyces sp. NPDC096013 TaxID=3366069 RepID=UPI003813638C
MTAPYAPRWDGEPMNPPTAPTASGPSTNPATTTAAATPATATAKALRNEVERLRAENEQLSEAVAAHAVVDQAIGVLTVLGPIAPADGFTVLREISQHTNTKLHQIAALPADLASELQAALARHHQPATPP